MKALLDTCTFLWITQGNECLSRKCLEAFRDPGNDVFLSSVSAWEISLKHDIGKLDLVDCPEVFVPEQRERHAIEALSLDERSTLMTGRLPKLHRDPFDRMLICQALVHGLTIFTPDRAIGQYPVPTLW